MNLNTMASKKIEYQPTEVKQFEVVETPNIILPRPYTSSELIKDVSSEELYTKDKFSNWKCFVLSRINILAVLIFLSSILSFFTSSPAIQAIIPPNWYPYVSAVLALVIFLERTLTKDHKNLIK